MPKDVVELADGSLLAVWRSGVEGGAPVLLLPGMSQDHRLYDVLVAELAARGVLEGDVETIAIDQRGTGDSDDMDRRDPPTTGSFADDAAWVLERLGVGRAHVVGHSMGGRIAQWLAIRHPERVASLTLLCTSPGDRHGVPRADDVDATIARCDPMEMALLSYTPAWLGAHHELAESADAATTTRSAQRGLHYRASHGHDAWDSLPRIAAPTVVVHGDADRVNPLGNGELLARRIPGAELVVLRGARHGLPVEHAAEIADVVLRRVAPRRSAQRR
ncbi:alpha/beta fold hydrolase [uncultured Arsenicicoccus sp.]|uniref:alpha/beta fold hydrolase n=1 Tax=uncultured Arsenicicoccus sp. TaxID=491339 RepID=UPI00259574A1|nr:alpha/beta fold hydrolase [uncultured Arsenicicoccus sp.]